MNWTALIEPVLWFGLFLLTLGAKRTAHAALDAAGRANLVAEYLMDRCGVSTDDVDRWHREQHPGCFDEEPHGGAS